MALAAIKTKMRRLKANSDWLYYIGYFAFLIGSTVTYSVTPITAMFLLKYAGLAMMFLYMLYMNRKSGWKTWLLLALVYSVALATSRMSGNKLLLEILIFITAFKDVDFNVFIKRDFWLRLGIVLVVMGLYAIGILNEVDRFRDDGVMRHALGFTHPNILGLQIVFLTLEFVYLNRQRKNFWSFLVVIAAIVFEYKIPNCRTAAIALVVLLPFLLMNKKMWKLVFGNKIFGYFLKSSFVIFLLIAFILAFWYTRDNAIMRSLNDTFSNRLNSAYYYLKNYGFYEPFGNNLTLEALGIGKVRRYALDMGYLSILVRYGWLAIGFLAIAYWLAMSFLQKNRNWTGMMILLVIAFYSMFETGTLFGSINPFLSFFAVAIYGTIRGLTLKTASSKGDILLLTWAEGDNYGTALQSWCLKQVINNFNEFEPNGGVIRREVDVLNYHVMMDNTSIDLKRGPIRKIERLFNRSTKQNVERFKFHLRRLKLKSKLQNRMKLFQEFRQDELELFPSEMIDDKKYLTKLPKFKTYLIGSDQVWNPKLLDSTYLLKWAPSDSEKISYAPSVCVDIIDRSDLKKYTSLREFTKISVREYTHAVEEISEYIDKEIEEVVDPVILYGRDKLLRQCHLNKNDDYCFIYFLGESEQHRRYARDFANINGLKAKAVIGVNKEHILADKILDEIAIWNLSPLMLIDAIFNSEVVITDSFHVVLLCVLLHKQFIVFPREKSNSQQNNRIITFLEGVNLEQRFGFAPKHIKDLHFTKTEWLTCDYMIELHRKKSLKYLERALRGNDNKSELEENQTFQIKKMNKITTKNTNDVEVHERQKHQKRGKMIDVVVNKNKNRHDVSGRKEHEENKDEQKQ